MEDDHKAGSASPEFGTSQPQLVSFIKFSQFSEIMGANICLSPADGIRNIFSKLKVTLITSFTIV
jgi:hypothetical protein